MKDVNQPVEVVRIIHSFDPCLSCAVHVMRPAEGAKIFSVSQATMTEKGVLPSPKVRLEPRSEKGLSFGS